MKSSSHVTAIVLIIDKLILGIQMVPIRLNKYLTTSLACLWRISLAAADDATKPNGQY